jgi:hypothetical protein
MMNTIPTLNPLSSAVACSKSNGVFNVSPSNRNDSPQFGLGVQYRSQRVPEEQGSFRKFEDALLRLCKPFMPYSLVENAPDEQTLWYDWTGNDEPVIVYRSPRSETKNAPKPTYSWVG